MEAHLKVLPLLILFAGHMSKIQTTLVGGLLRIAGYALLLFNITFVDPFSDMLVLISVIVGAITTLYSAHYSRLKYNRLNLPLITDLFTLSMIYVFASRYLFEFITFWLLTELIGFFLIAYDYIIAGERSSMYAAMKYLLFSMIPTDISLFIILALTGFNEAFETDLMIIKPILSNPAISFLVTLGFFSKAAIFPLHFWLPDAHSVAPSPASALLSGIMVKMGIYGLYLLTNYYINRELVLYTMLISGGFTVIYGALQAIVQKDIKRILAYSTTSNTALITIILGLFLFSGDRIFLEAAILYTLIHALYKSSLFLDSGFVEVLTHSRNLDDLGYISKINPLETVATIFSILVMLGLPPSVGFLAKVFLFSSISKYLGDSLIYLLALIVASAKVFLSIIYNVTYLKAHIGNEMRGNAELNRRASILQPYVIALVSMTFVITFIIMTFDYSGLTEFTLLKKLRLPLLISTILLTFAGLFVFKVLGFNKGGSGGLRFLILKEKLRIGQKEEIALFLNLLMVAVVATTGILHLSYILIESGLKLFTISLFLTIVVRRLKGTYLYSSLALISLLSFYLFELKGGVAIPVYFASCLLFSLLTDNSGVGRAIALSWYYISTSLILLSPLDVVLKGWSTLISLLAVTTLKSKFEIKLPKANIVIRLPKFINVYDKLPLIIAKVVNKKLNRACFLPDEIQKDLYTSFKIKLAGFSLDLNAEKIVIKSGYTLITYASTLEYYVNHFAGEVLLLLIGLSSKMLAFERNFSNKLHNISSHVERLQHNVEQALIYLLFLMSVLLLVTIIVYILYSTG